METENQTQSEQKEIIESIEELRSHLDELENLIGELESIISESSEQLKYLKSGM